MSPFSEDEHPIMDRATMQQSAMAIVVFTGDVLHVIAGSGVRAAVLRTAAEREAPSW